jgi:hypothetical protein
MYKSAMEYRRKAADTAARKVAGKTARKHKAAAENAGADQAARKLALDLNAQQDARIAAMMGVYRQKKGGPRPA